jgi:hypothetical protein
MNKSMTNRLEVLRSGKSLSKKTTDEDSDTESEAISDFSNAKPQARINQNLKSQK